MEEKIDVKIKDSVVEILIPAKKIEGKKSKLIPLDIDKDTLMELESIGNTLKEVCIRKKGAGLSACQIGIFKSMFVWKAKDKWELVINPQTFIKKKSVLAHEGCLSYPDKVYFIQRCKQVWVKYYIVQNHKLKMKARQLNGYNAIVFQHEYDHSIGKTLKTEGRLDEERSDLKKKAEKEKKRIEKLKAKKVDVKPKVENTKVHKIQNR